MNQSPASQVFCAYVFENVISAVLVPVSATNPLQRLRFPGSQLMPATGIQCLAHVLVTSWNILVQFSRAGALAWHAHFVLFCLDIISSVCFALIMTVQVAVAAPCQVVVVGDTHGQFHDVCHM